MDGLDMLEGYDGVGEMLAALRAEVAERDRILGRAESMRERLTSHGGGYEPRVSASKSDVNGTAKVIALADFEERNRRRVERAERMRSQAHDLIYGDTNPNAGIEAYMGQVAADSLWLYYGGNMSWREVAEWLHVSHNTCKLAAAAAIERTDNLGWRFVATGDAWADAT